MTEAMDAAADSYGLALVPIVAVVWAFFVAIWWRLRGIPESPSSN